MKPKPKLIAEKKLRAVMREMKAIERKISNAPLVRLKEPIPKGFVRRYVLTPEALARKEVLALRAILRVIGTEQYFWRRSFRRSRRAGTRMIEFDQPLLVVRLNDRLWSQMCQDQWLPYFRLEFRGNAQFRKQWCFVFRNPQFYQLKVERRYITHEKIIDPLLVERHSELAQWSECHAGRDRYRRLKGRRAEWKGVRSSETLRHSKRDFQRYLRNREEVESCLRINRAVSIQLLRLTHPMKPNPKLIAEKKLRAVMREMKAIERKIRETPLVRLKEPIPKGIFREQLVLSAAAVDHPDADTLRGLLGLIGWYWARSFVGSLLIIPQVELSWRQDQIRRWYGGRSDNWQQFFRLEYRGTLWFPRQWCYVLKSRRWFEVRVERKYITHQKIIDPLLMERHAELVQWSNCHAGRPRYRRSKDKDCKPSKIVRHSKRDFQRYLRNREEVESSLRANDKNAVSIQLLPAKTTPCKQNENEPEGDSREEIAGISPGIKGIASRIKSPPCPAF